ncbi:hypothetical protein ABTH91_21650, partial [Acinetobacter baumannii]
MWAQVDAQIPLDALQSLRQMDDRRQSQQTSKMIRLPFMPDVPALPVEARFDYQVRDMCTSCFKEVRAVCHVRMEAEP